MIQLKDIWRHALNQHDHFLIVGRVGMDLYPLPDGTKIEQAEQFKTDIGGSAGNIAVALVKAGEKAALLSCVSDDGVGDFVRHKMAHYGVDMSAVGIAGGTARTSLALAETRASSPNVVIYRNGAADLYLDDTLINALDLDAVKAIIITGTALSYQPALDQLVRLCQKAQSTHIPIVLDVDYRPSAWESEAAAKEALVQLLPACDIIVGNDDEFAVIAGGSAQDGYEAAKSLALKEQLVLYKKGEAGCEAFFKETSLSVGIFKVDIKKPFGAGDAFLGNLLTALAQDKTLQEAITNGAAAAAYVVSRSGCASAMPNKQQLADFIANHHS